MPNVHDVEVRVERWDAKEKLLPVTALSHSASSGRNTSHTNKVEMVKPQRSQLRQKRMHILLMTVQ